MKALQIAAVLCCVPIVALVAVYVTLGRTPATALLTHGGAMFLPVAKDSDRLSGSIRRVLAGDAGDPRPGTFEWRETEPGVEVGELPVLVDGKPVDRLFLAKIDPARFRVIARNDPSALTTVDGWRRALAAVLVVNGSYYATSGLPDTPFVAAGRQIGPILTTRDRARWWFQTKGSPSMTSRMPTGSASSKGRGTRSSPIRCWSPTGSRVP